MNKQMKKYCVAISLGTFFVNVSAKDDKEAKEKAIERLGKRKIEGLLKDGVHPRLYEKRFSVEEIK